MELCIVKEGKIYARSSGAGSADDYSFRIFETVPEYPYETAGTGKYWDLQIENGELRWVAAERELTTGEKIDKIAEEMEQIKKAWKAGESVAIGDLRYDDGVWYRCIQAHTTQSDWKPKNTPALWEEVTN